MKRVAQTVSLGLGLALAACSSSGNTVWSAPELPMVRRDGYRIAVMPFTISAPQQGFQRPELGALGNVLSLGGLSDDAPTRVVTAHLLRRGMVWTLSDSPFDVMALWVTDTQLTHHQLDPSTASPQRIAKALGVDGILYGDVTTWNGSAHGAQSYATAGLSVHLVDGRTGQSLFEGTHAEEVAEGPSEGASSGPEQATSPEGGNMIAAGRRLVLYLGGQIAGREPRAMLTPEAGGGISPTLSFVSVAAERDGPLVAGDRIRVVAVGTPDSDVRFAIGHYQTAIPMPSVAVTKDPRGDRATYIGTYVVQAGERLEPTRIRVTIEKLGLRHAKYVRAPQISIAAAPSK